MAQLRLLPLSFLSQSPYLRDGEGQLKRKEVPLSLHKHQDSNLQCVSWDEGGEGARGPFGEGVGG